MKKLLLTLIAVVLLTANVASAAWMAVGETDNYITYADLTTISKSGNVELLAKLFLKRSAITFDARISAS